MFTVGIPFVVFGGWGFVFSYIVLVALPKNLHLLGKVGDLDVDHLNNQFGAVKFWLVLWYLVYGVSLILK